MKFFFNFIGVSPIDLLATTLEIQQLRQENDEKNAKIIELQDMLKKLATENENLKEELNENHVSKFSVKSVLEKESKIKGLFKYYTAIEHNRFKTLLQFLLPESFMLEYEKGRTDIKKLLQEDCLFLTLIRLRHNFGLKDIAMRFDLTVQSASSIFNTWVDHIYLKFGQLSIWPHRDTIIENMPKDFKSDFPNTLIIIDGTEIKTQTPCALGLQSQLYSDYKGNTTLKALIGCDPCGSVIFISELFTGSISDKAITEQSGFYSLLNQLKELGYVQEGDAVMADKGFTIETELKKMGLKLNIPPFASCGSQMSAADSYQTLKIAKHRVHIERVIAKVKTFQILSNTVPTNLFHSINKIWSICCYLTLFQDTFVTDKKSSNKE